jgi:hypothetical protein
MFKQSRGSLYDRNSICICPLLCALCYHSNASKQNKKNAKKLNAIFLQTEAISSFASYPYQTLQ